MGRLVHCGFQRIAVFQKIHLGRNFYVSRKNKRDVFVRKTDHYRIIIVIAKRAEILFYRRYHLAHYIPAQIYFVAGGRG